MKSKFDIALYCLVFFNLLLYVSCGEKLNTQIGYIKNNTNSDLVGANWYESMTDSVLCNDRVYFRYYIQPNLTEGLSTGGNKRLSEEPDSSKEYIYIFNPDSLDKYQKLKICAGIVKHCLIKKIEIQLNRVKEPMDTVFINSDKPLN